MKKILFVLTSHAELGDTGEKTGFWLEEAVSPFYEFVDRGFEVTLASPKGGEPPLDPKSSAAEWQTEATRRFYQDAETQARFKQTKVLLELKAEHYDAIFLPGGHGPMWDLATNETLGKLISEFDRQGKVVAAVCHAPAGLLTAVNAERTPFVKGKRLTAFTNTEEKAVRLEQVVPFLLEDKLKETGANFVRGTNDFESFVVADGNLVTGQNPQSSTAAARKVSEILEQKGVTKMNIADTANEFFKRYREQNVPAMIELFETGGIVEYPPAKLSGDVKDIGPGSWSVLIDAFPDLTNEVGRVWTDEANKTAFVDVFIGGTQTKDIWGIVNQGKKYWMRHLFVFEMNDDGKIKHLTSFWDNSDWWSQLGKNTIA